MTRGDKAVWNRVRVVPFEATFCKNAPESHEEQLKQKKFPMDPYFHEKINKLTPALAWYLINRRLGGLKYVEPLKVHLATERYKRCSDTYSQFIDELIAESPKSKVTLSEIYSSFRDWYKESIGHDVPKKNELKEYLIKIWGACIGRNQEWTGWRLHGGVDESEEEVLDEKEEF